MAGVGVKILKPGGEKMDKFEESVSQVWLNLQCALWSLCKSAMELDSSVVDVL